MAPTLTTYIYPWDVARGGIDSILDELADCGVGGLNLAANYHAITALSPRGTHARLFFLPRGAVFFPARAERYGRIKPFVWPDPEVTDAWAIGAHRAAERGFGVQAWTIGMFQPWIAQDYPFAARVLATGDRVDTGICPNSPDVHEYLAMLAVDLAEQAPIRRVILEGVGIPEWNYGWVRPRVLANVSSVGKLVLALCFCDSCRTTAAASLGLDVDAVKTAALDLLSRFGITAPNDSDPSAEDVLSENDELRAYASLGRMGATELVRSVARALAESGSEARLLIPLSGADLDSNEADLDSVLAEIGGVNVWTAVMPLEAQRTFLPKLQNAHPDMALSLVIGPPLASGAPVHLVTPSYDYSDPTFLERIRTARMLEPDEIAIYHYGLLERSAFRQTLDAVASGGGPA